MGTQTNETTRHILDYLIKQGHFVWRQNVLPVPVAGGGYRSGGKAGIPDIIGVTGNIRGRAGGLFLGIEIKTGKDRLRDEQIAFHSQAQKLGAIILVVKSFEDFLSQWEELMKNI